jgi:hypothetical protein
MHTSEIWRFGFVRIGLAVRSGGHGLVVINPKLNISPTGELIVSEFCYLMILRQTSVFTRIQIFHFLFISN